MSSTGAGTPPAPGNGAPPRGRSRSRDLRDRPLGRIVLLGALLVVALLVARTCGSNQQEVTQEEAIELAKAEASFEPCSQTACVQVRYVPRGVPVRGFWGVVLSDELVDDGRPSRTETFLVDVQTGDVTRT
jgi:hypothetical protein